MATKKFYLPFDDSVRFLLNKRFKSGGTTIYTSSFVFLIRPWYGNHKHSEGMQGSFGYEY